MAVSSVVLEPILQGEARQIDFSPVSPPEDISAYTLVFEVRRTYGGTSSALVSKTEGSGITVTNAANGNYSVLLTSADTLSLSPRTYYWSVWRTDSGSEAVLARGSVAIVAFDFPS